MLTAGLYTHDEIQKAIRISHNTLWEWQLNRIFLDEVDRLTLEQRDINLAGLIRECLYGLYNKKIKFECSLVLFRILSWLKARPGLNFTPPFYFINCA